MVNCKEQEMKCGSCKEVTGNVFVGMVYCHYLNCDVYSESVMCQHGRDLQECF